MWPSPKNFSGISGEVFQRNLLGKISEEFLRNFSKLSLKTVIPQKSLILGTNAGKFLENFRGISYRKWFLRNSSEILQRKSPWLENLGKFLTFVTWEQPKVIDYISTHSHRVNISQYLFCFIHNALETTFFR